MKKFHIVLILLVVTIWGLNNLAIKLAVGHVGPLTLMAVRASLTALVLSPWLHEWRYCQKWLTVIAISLLFGGCYYALFYETMQRLSASDATLLMQLQVPMAVVLSAVLFGQRISAVCYVGICIALVGLMVVLGFPHSLTSISGISFSLAGGLCWALSNNLMKSDHGLSPIALFGTIAVLSVPILWALALWTEPTGVHSLIQSFGWSLAGEIAFMVLGSGTLAYIVWYYLLRHYTIAQVSPYTFITPLVAVFGADLWLGDVCSLSQVMGTALCLLGIALTVLTKAQWLTLFGSFKKSSIQKDTL